MWSLEVGDQGASRPGGGQSPLPVCGLLISPNVLTWWKESQQTLRSLLKGHLSHF